MVEVKRSGWRGVGRFQTAKVFLLNAAGHQPANKGVGRFQTAKVFLLAAERLAVRAAIGVLVAFKQRRCFSPTPHNTLITR